MDCIIKIKTISQENDLINNDLRGVVKVNGDCAALSPFLGMVQAIGFMDCGSEESYKDFMLDDFGNNEAELIQTFLNHVYGLLYNDRYGSVYKWITWNGRTFDIPFLLHRIYILTRNQKLSFPNGFDLFRFFPSFNKFLPYQKFDKFGGVPYIAEEATVVKPYMKMFLDKEDDIMANTLAVVACNYNLELKHDDVGFKSMIEFDQLNFGNPHYKSMEFYRHLLENEVSFINQLKEFAI